MAKLTPEEKQEWHNRGQEDGAEGRSLVFHGPWMTPFESDEHYEGRDKAYREGHENGLKQKTD